MNPLERKCVVAVARIAELARNAANNQNGQQFFTGIMFSLSILYEEFTGQKLQDGNVTPKMVMAWAYTVMQTERMVDRII